MRPLVLGLAALALLTAAAPAAAQDATTLVVVEQASVAVKPDTAVLQASIRRRAARSAVARRAVERRLRAALADLRALGLPRADIRTTGISAYSERRDGRRVRVASTSLELRVRDLAKLPGVVAAFDGGASIEGPEFSVSDDTAARAEATGIALGRARRRAEAAAAAVGLRLVAIRRIDLNPELGFSGGDDAEAGGGAAAPERDITIRPGRERVEVAVAVVYELGP